MPNQVELETAADRFPLKSWEAITGGENLLVLAPRPGDESLLAGGLIARSCRRGRPPFVVVLTDGSAAGSGGSPQQVANLHERETRAAVRCLGLPANRLLMAGLFDGSVPADGSAFDAVVAGVILVMWARDCNIICAPWPDPGSSDQVAAYRVASAVARRSGVGLLACLGSGQWQDAAASPGLFGWRLDIGTEIAAKREAVGQHAALFGPRADQAFDGKPYEAFVIPPAENAAAD